MDQEGNELLNQHLFHVERFLQLKQLWNETPEKLSDYYEDIPDYDFWREWHRRERDQSEPDCNWPEAMKWSVIANATGVLRTKGSFADRNYTGNEQQCYKAVHKVDLCNQDEVKRYYNFLNYARETDTHPNFLRVTGVYVKSDRLSTHYIITELPAGCLSNLNGLIITSHHLIIPHIMDEIVRELLDALSFLHSRTTFQRQRPILISADSIVCKSRTSIIPIALVDLNYCGPEEYYLDGEITSPFCPEVRHRARTQWLYYETFQKNNISYSYNGSHMLAPEIVRNRLRVKGVRNEHYELPDFKSDIFHLGSIIFELVNNRMPLYRISSEHPCETHAFRLGDVYSSQNYYDLLNCQACQRCYLENVMRFTEVREDRELLEDTHNTDALLYYGRKYTELINQTVQSQPRYRPSAATLLRNWESCHRGKAGAEVIKQAGSNGKQQCFDRDQYLNNNSGYSFPLVPDQFYKWLMSFENPGLLNNRRTYAQVVGERLITNQAIGCRRDGNNFDISRNLAQLIVSHIWNQIAYDDVVHVRRFHRVAGVNWNKQLDEVRRQLNQD